MDIILFVPIRSQHNDICHDTQQGLEFIDNEFNLDSNRYNRFY
jgi:hypothetical protein